MKSNLEDTQVFIEVVEARSFTQAAERLAKTKSAVSQSITRLENNLGVKLLYRSTRTLALTDAGREFYSHSCDIRESYEKAVESIQSFGAKASGTLTVTAPHALSRELITPVIAKMAEHNSDLSVRLIAEDKPVELIDSQIDVAIRVGKLDVQTAKITKLGQLNESLYASSHYVEKIGGVGILIDKLSECTHIANDWQGAHITYQLGGQKIKVTPRISCNSYHDIVALVIKGSGVARLADVAVSPYLKNGTLVRIAPIASTPVHAMHIFDNKPPAKVKEFIQVLKAQLQGNAAWLNR